MTRIAGDATELIGSTPLLRLDSFGGVLAKLEQFNPYSVKDRIAREMAVLPDSGERYLSTDLFE